MDYQEILNLLLEYQGKSVSYEMINENIYKDKNMSMDGLRALVRRLRVKLVDDMISTGGSIVKATQFLKKQKCKKVYVACTHALLMNDAERKIKKAGVTKIISANTIPGKTSIVDISNIIAKAI